MAGDASVPAGNYTNQALSTVGCLSTPTARPARTAPAPRHLMERRRGQGELAEFRGQRKRAQSGAPWRSRLRSDVYRFGGVKVIGVVPDDTHKNIIHPAASASDSTQAEAANEFISGLPPTPMPRNFGRRGFELVS
ncbi:MAG: hypothetical protein ACLTMP_11435 [Eggerthella lenta]